MAKFYERKDYVQYKAGEWGVTEEEARRKLEEEEKKLKQECLEYFSSLGLSEEDCEKCWKESREETERFFDYERHDIDQDEQSEEDNKCQK